MVKLIIRTSLVLVVAILLVTVARSQVDPNKRLLVAHEKDETSGVTHNYMLRGGRTDEVAAMEEQQFSLADSATGISATLFSPDLLTPVEDEGPAAGPAGVDLGLGGTREPTVAVNPTDSQNVAAASLFQLRVSTNGGVSFQSPVSPVVDPAQVLCGDPSLAFDSQDRHWKQHRYARVCLDRPEPMAVNFLVARTVSGQL